MMKPPRFRWKRWSGGALVLPVLHETMPVNMNTVRLAMAAQTLGMRTMRPEALKDLTMNELELESVSLTGLDQTSIEHFNANNAFDAEGLTKLTEQIELRKKARNDIEQDARVQIETDRAAQEARIAQEQALEIFRQEQQVAVQNKSREESQAKAEADEARAKSAAAQEQVTTARETEVDAPSFFRGAVHCRWKTRQSFDKLRMDGTGGMGLA